MGPRTQIISGLELARAVDRAAGIPAKRRELMASIDHAIAYRGWFLKRFREFRRRYPKRRLAAEGAMVECLVTLVQEAIVHREDKAQFDRTMKVLRAIVGTPKHLTVPQLKQILAFDSSERTIASAS